MDNKKGKLIVVSGPAGSGKGTVNSILLGNTENAFQHFGSSRASKTCYSQYLSFFQLKAYVL